MLELVGVWKPGYGHVVKGGRGYHRGRVVLSGRDGFFVEALVVVPGEYILVSVFLDGGIVRHLPQAVFVGFVVWSLVGSAIDDEFHEVCLTPVEGDFQGHLGERDLCHFDSFRLVSSGGSSEPGVYYCCFLGERGVECVSEVEQVSVREAVAAAGACFRVGYLCGGLTVLQWWQW